jgi:hypothetical protein
VATRAMAADQIDQAAGLRMRTLSRCGGRIRLQPMGFPCSLVSRSPMYAARAGSGLVKRCASSPPSQRSSATTSPDGLRDKTCQCPPAVSHRRSVSSADPITTSRCQRWSSRGDLPLRVEIGRVLMTTAAFAPATALSWGLGELTMALAAEQLMRSVEEVRQRYLT